MKIGIDLLLVIFYFLVVLIIGIFAARKQSKEDFLIAERKLGIFSIATSVAASFMGGGILVAYVSYVYQFGLAALWLFVGIIAGFLLLLLYQKKLKRLADKEEFYTISDYFKFKYGKNTGLISVIVVLLYFFFFLMIELIAGGKILSSLLEIPYAFAVIIMAIVVLIYLGLGGFKSVIKTDVFQYLIVLIFAIVIVFFVTNGNPIPFAELDMANMGFGTSFAFVILGMFGTFVAPDLWQRVYAAKNVKTARKALYWSSGLVFVFGFAIALIGIIAKVNFPNILAEEALVYGLSNLLPVGILGLGLVMLFAVIMSSMDTALFVLGMNISEDIARNRKELSKKQLMNITRWAILGFTVLSVLVSIFIQDIITIALAGASISYCLIPAIIGSFHFNLKRKAVFLSVLTGIISVILILSLGYISPESSLIALPISFVFLLIGQFVFK